LGYGHFLILRFDQGQEYFSATLFGYVPFGHKSAPFLSIPVIATRIAT
jgi:hypothetical protein